MLYTNENEFQYFQSWFIIQNNLIPTSTVLFRCESTYLENYRANGGAGDTNHARFARFPQTGAMHSANPGSKSCGRKLTFVLHSYYHELLSIIVLDIIFA